MWRIEQAAMVAALVPTRFSDHGAENPAGAIAV